VLASLVLELVVVLVLASLVLVWVRVSAQVVEPTRLWSRPKSEVVNGCGVFNQRCQISIHFRNFHFVSSVQSEKDLHLPL
jgi:hypothetical protein